jgi:hypothetical protein
LQVFSLKSHARDGIKHRYKKDNFAGGLRNIGRYQDIALVQPVAVTRNGRERTVMISIEEYNRLKRRDRRCSSLQTSRAQTLRPWSKPGRRTPPKRSMMN